MINKQKLDLVLAAYRRDFHRPNPESKNKTHWEDEQYKWIAVKHFQDHWDIEAGDFAAMFKEATRKHENLLTAQAYFPRSMILEFAASDPEAVRQMFRDLYDENKSVVDRVNKFINEAERLRSTYGADKWKSHYQNVNSVSTYLWSKYPDKYYIYKYSECKEVAATLESDFKVKKGAKADALIDFIGFYDEIANYLMNDDETRSMVEAALTPECYRDPKLRTLTIDVGYYISRSYEEKKKEPDKGGHEKKYWIYSPGENAGEWKRFFDSGIMAIGWSDIGDLSKFRSKDEMKDKMKEVYGDDVPYTMAAHATWQFANDMNPGDVVFVKKGRTKIIGRGVVTGEYYYDESIEDGYKNIRTVNWTDSGDYPYPGTASMKTLTDISSDKEYIEKLNSLFENSGSLGNNTSVLEPYSKENFLSEVFMTEEKYEDLISILNRKKNVILKGAPGVGKTFAAKRLAYSIMEVKDDSRVEFIQFHQNYSYEDFIMGYKPNGDGFELKEGIFYRFCEKAASQPDKDFFFIIDEINRGNLSKIFGELLMLIESDYRDESAVLAYTGLPFTIPKNLYIIGMMNTADRSLALIDYALRRRFSFFDMEPGFESEGFKAYEKSLGNSKFDALIEGIKELNAEIEKDDSLGKGFLIGHSYFCNCSECTDQWMKQIVEFDIIPTLEEYWFDNKKKFEEQAEKLRKIVK